MSSWSCAADVAVIECRVSYLRPLRFDDVVDVHLKLGAAGRASFAMGYPLRNVVRPAL